MWGVWVLDKLLREGVHASLMHACGKNSEKKVLRPSAAGLDLSRAHTADVPSDAALLAVCLALFTSLARARRGQGPWR